MKLFGAFLKLVRWPNLVFIALTQILFYYCFVYSVEKGLPFHPNLLPPFLLFLLVLASVCIAAAGYIINDYFDLNIDKINKPAKLIVEKIIHRRWAIIWHLVLTSVGVILSFYIGYKINNWLLGLMNLFTALLLWGYSTTFKKQLLIGNITISLLTAWVILVLYLCELRLFYVFNVQSEQYYNYITLLFKVTILYSGFAFIISLVREVIKDMEDIRGDERWGCRTMPIVWGVQAAKVFTATWLVVLIAALAIIQVYVIQIHWWWLAVYCIVFIISPLLFLFRDLYRAVKKKDFHRLSTGIKLVMLTGILSMLLFKIYH
ncbi:MAG: geranylgeranylglycerol-phosphate geranylgeranyltransferase [Chitinophagaceae bacterium]